MADEVPPPPPGGDNDAPKPAAGKGAKTGYSTKLISAFLIFGIVMIGVGLILPQLMDTFMGQRPEQYWAKYDTNRDGICEKNKLYYDDLETHDTMTTIDDVLTQLGSMVYSIGISLMFVGLFVGGLLAVDLPVNMRIALIVAGGLMAWGVF